MTPHEFIAKWRASTLTERSASHQHFLDLCEPLDEPKPADVWKRHHFAWEYKGKRADLDTAYDQLRQYALALENPPLLICGRSLACRSRGDNIDATANSGFRYGAHVCGGARDTGIRNRHGADAAHPSGDDGYRVSHPHDAVE